MLLVLLRQSEVADCLLKDRLDPVADFSNGPPATWSASGRGRGRASVTSRRSYEPAQVLRQSSPAMRDRCVERVAQEVDVQRCQAAAGRISRIARRSPRGRRDHELDPAEPARLQRRPRTVLPARGARPVGQLHGQHVAPAPHPSTPIATCTARCDHAYLAHFLVARVDDQYGRPSPSAAARGTPPAPRPSSCLTALIAEPRRRAHTSCLSDRLHLPRPHPPRTYISASAATKAFSERSVALDPPLRAAPRRSCRTRTLQLSTPASSGSGCRRPPVPVTPLCRITGSLRRARRASLSASSPCELRTWRLISQ